MSCSKAGSTFSRKNKTAESADQSPEAEEAVIENAMQKITGDVSEEDLAFDPAQTDSSQHDPSSEELPGNSSYKVAMVTDTAGINDQSFNQAAWEGLTMLNADTGANVKYLGIKNDSDYTNCLESLIGEDYSFIWGIGYESADAVKAEALKHPDVKFAVIDYAFDETVDNLTGVTFRAEEPSFMAGYIAVAVSEKNRIGFIGGSGGDTIDAFQYGYLAGATYANKELSKDVTIDVSYAGSFTDHEKGYALAKEMYDNGVDVIFHAAGATGTGVIEAAKEAGKGYYVIGVDRDQSYLAPENVLTSVIKNISIAIENVSVQYMLNDNINGINLDFGLSEHAVGISSVHDNFSQDVYDRALEIGKDIASGILTVPKDQSQYDEFITGLQEE